MTTPGYVPEAGDVVWCNFDPQAGHRITTKIKGYAFEVLLTGTPPSVVLADQVKNKDWRVRKARVTAAELAEVRAKLATLIR